MRWFIDYRNNSCPFCRRVTDFLYVEDSTFQVLGESFHITVAVGNAFVGTRYERHDFAIKTYEPMLLSLARYEQRLIDLGIVAEVVEFRFRGTRLEVGHKLIHFGRGYYIGPNDMIEAVIPIVIYFKYVGNRRESFTSVASGHTHTSIRDFEDQFKQVYYQSVGSYTEVV